MRFLGAFLLLVAALAGASRDTVLWYAQPATKWTEALPIGGGRLGAMVFGGISEERVQFNEDTLWRGRPRDYVRAGAKENYAELKRLLLAGQSREAERTRARDLHRRPEAPDALPAVWRCEVELRGSRGRHRLSSQTRSRRAVVSTSYRIGEVTYTRKAFASYPDNVIA